MSGFGTITGTPPSELDYVERATSFTTTSVDAATPDIYVQGNFVTYDGTTKIRVEFFCAQAAPAAGGYIFFLLRERNVAARGLIAVIGAGGPVNAVREFTPTAGSHGYEITTYVSGGNGNIWAGGGTGSAQVPTFLRVVRV